MYGSFPQYVAQWHDFYTMAGTAAATLMGLLFVSLSLRTDLATARYETERGVWGLAAVAFVSFLDILLIALIFLVPDPEPRGIGLPLVTIGLLAIGTSLASEVWTQQTGSPLTNWLFPAPSFLGYLGQLGVAFSLVEGRADALPWLVPIVVVLLLAGAYASWVLLRNPILRRLKSTTLQAEDPVADA
jgi:hypothetical protein